MAQGLEVVVAHGLGVGGEALVAQDVPAAEVEHGRGVVHGEGPGVEVDFEPAGKLGTEAELLEGLGGPGLHAGLQLATVGGACRVQPEVRLPPREVEWLAPAVQATEDAFHVGELIPLRRA